MKRIILHPEALTELRVAERFYQEGGGHELAANFIARVEAALRLISRDPSRFPHLLTERKIQKCRVKHFPFSLYYIDRKNDVWVIAITHHKRKPGYWKRRV